MPGPRAQDATKPSGSSSSPSKKVPSVKKSPEQERRGIIEELHRKFYKLNDKFSVNVTSDKRDDVKLELDKPSGYKISTGTVEKFAREATKNSEDYKVEVILTKGKYEFRLTYIGDSVAQSKQRARNEAY
ncbi:hypothetical protein BTUL_0251g00090 [Botrytis tulipae]|uniref:Uncharacterized protein n=1 Tax=Botrytis tulipae TaxID=87230 RepID=A0A4Z1EEL5_9HELO|nr:hypothetical protein BTUL_0251g00090 [Botrytis tulipae]